MSRRLDSDDDDSAPGSDVLFDDDPTGRPPKLPGGQETFDRSYVEKLRQENATWRQRFRSKVESKDEEIRSLRVDAGLTEAMHKLGANPRLTRAVLKADGTLSKLDPAAADFNAQIETLVAEVMEQTPELRRGGGSGLTRLGGELNGPGAGSSNQLTREEAASLKPDDVAAALKSGRLDALLGRGH